jgi:hypothetical protein
MVKAILIVYGSIVLIAGLIDRWYCIWRFRRDRARNKAD